MFMLIPMFVAALAATTERISVAAPSPVGFAKGAPPANVPVGDQFPGVSQAPPVLPFHERTVCALTEAAAIRQAPSRHSPRFGSTDLK